MKDKILTIIFTIILITTITTNAVPAPRIHKANGINYIIGNNSPPNKPVLTVPDKIIVGKPFKIEVVFTDPDGDDMYIRFNASFLPILPDIWWGTIQSGTTHEAEVTYWGPLGTYTMGVQAKDVHDAESEWTYVQLNVTKSKTINTSFL